jgi:hypothetical protein
MSWENPENDLEKVQRVMSYTRKSESDALEFLSKFDGDWQQALHWYWLNVVLICDIDD